MCDVIFSAAQAAALAPTKEAPDMILGSQLCPVDPVRETDSFTLSFHTNFIL